MTTIYTPKLTSADIATIFWLLANETYVSYARFAKVLDIHEATAYRLANHLVQKQKLRVVHDRDPVTHRKMKLLQLPEFLPCLVLDTQINAYDMALFYADGDRIHHIRQPYHHTYDGENGLALNKQRLWQNASLIWDISSQTPCVQVGASTPIISCAHTEVGMPQDKQDALVYGLTHHPDIAEQTSVLFLHTGEMPYGLYLERDNVASPWRVCYERYVTVHLGLLRWNMGMPPKERQALLDKLLHTMKKDYLISNPPDLIIIEETTHTHRNTPKDGLKFSIPSKGTPPMVYHHTGVIPFHVYGCFWKFREATWISSMAEFLPEKKT